MSWRIHSASLSGEVPPGAVFRTFRNGKYWKRKSRFLPFVQNGRRFILNVEDFEFGMLSALCHQLEQADPDQVPQ